MASTAREPIVADLGNSRLKWGRVDRARAGRLSATLALPVDDPSQWASAWESWGLDRSTWAVSTVNPPVAERLEAFLEERGVLEVRWYRSAAEVPVRHELEHAETAGADRAWAVVGALGLTVAGRPGLVVSCGSAITVERVGSGGAWQGGAILPGPGLSARALHLLTAQLPLVAPRGSPPAWGRSTRPALEAGLYWGVVGAVREVIARQSADLGSAPWLIWTGGDAPELSAAVAGPDARVVPDLVLEGLARAVLG